jgi:hypothetical protein
MFAFSIADLSTSILALIEENVIIIIEKPPATYLLWYNWAISTALEKVWLRWSTS